MDLLVTYDIGVPDPAGQRRLAAVAKVCEGFGVRVQYSVFECRLSPARYEEFLGELLDVIDPDQDVVHLYHFPGDLAGARRVLGRQRDISIEGPWLA